MGEVSLAPTQQAPSPKRLEAGKQHGAACCLLCMQPAWVSPMSKEGRAGLLQDRLAWVPHPTHFIPLPRHLPHRATPRREQASENVTCPGRECWGRGTRVCGRLSSGVSPPRSGWPWCWEGHGLGFGEPINFQLLQVPCNRLVLALAPPASKKLFFQRIKEHLSVKCAYLKHKREESWRARDPAKT